VRVEPSAQKHIGGKRSWHPHDVELLQHSPKAQFGHELETQVHLPLWHCRWFEQVPHERGLPHPSFADPQDRLCAEQVFGAQHWLW
jgi:hypothetical protein